MIDRSDFDKAFVRWYADLYLFALRIVKDEETGKDIVNDAFEYLWKRLDEAEESTLRTYLFTIVRSRCIDHLRKLDNQNRYVEFASSMSQKYVELDTGEPDERLRLIGEAM